MVLVLVIRSIHSSGKNSLNKTQEKDLTKSVRIAFASNVLLGTTWIFGLLAVGDLRDVFQWLFTIFNSLQGLFIFIFFAVRNVDVRKKWSQLLSQFSVTTISDSQTLMHKSKISSPVDEDGKSCTSESGFRF